MLTNQPTPPAPTGRAPAGDDRRTWTRVRDLTHHLRRIYTAAYSPAFNEAVQVESRFELPDGTRLDPHVAADAVACRWLNDTLAAVVADHLPGARLIARADDAPTVIASSWHYATAETAETFEIVIEWDCTYDFGDPNGLTVHATPTPATTGTANR